MNFTTRQPIRSTGEALTGKDVLKERLLGTNEEDRQLIEGIIKGEIRGSAKLYERGTEED